MLIFPYFLGDGIQQHLPSMRMLDYRVAYSNHKYDDSLCPHFSFVSKNILCFVIFVVIDCGQKLS